MTKTEELEERILGQIGMLNDLSTTHSKEESTELIERSKVMAELTKSYIEVQKTKIEEKKVKVEAVRVFHECSTGFKVPDERVEKYLGIASE